MKRKISDLLDEYSGPDIELDMKTPLSSERIKVLTMKKIGEKNAPKKRRVTFRVMIAAAIVVALVVSVFAVGNGAEWFRAFFTLRSDAALSNEQIIYIEENAVELNQSQTVNGYTVTLDSYISDGRTTYLKLKIQMPEGTELPDGGCWFGKWPALYRSGEECRSYHISRQKVDLDHEAGIATYQVTLDGTAYRNSAISAGETLVLELTDLVVENHDETVLTQGTWRFELDLFDTRQLQLLDEPMEGFLANNLEGEPFEVTLISVTLRSMSMEAVYQVPVEHMFDDPWFDDVSVVMDDGSIVLVTQEGLQGYGGSKGSMEWIEFVMDAPIDLDKVAYIEFPGGIRIPVTAE